MVTALAADDQGGSALLIEKSPQYGGSSAMSGGGLWVPNNHLMAGVGIPDTREEAMEYMHATTAGLVPEDRLQAYVDESPKMAKFLCDKTQIELVASLSNPLAASNHRIRAIIHHRAASSPRREVTRMKSTSGTR